MKGDGEFAEGDENDPIGGWRGNEVVLGRAVKEAVEGYRRL